MSKSAEPKNELVVEPKTKSVTEAVKELRIRLGETQQSLATKLKIAISTMVRYETNRPPRGEALVRFMKLAGAHNLVELERIFQSALEAELGHDVMRVVASDIELAPGEDEEVGALLSILRLQGPLYEKARASWRRISEPIKAANRDKDFRAGAHMGLIRSIQKRIEAGFSDGQILDAIPQANAGWIEAARQFLGMRKKLATPAAAVPFIISVENLVDKGHTDEQILAAVPGATIELIKLVREHTPTRTMDSIFEERKPK